MQGNRLAIFLFACSTLIWSQQNPSSAGTAASSTTGHPHLVKFSGTLTRTGGTPPNGMVAATFALYSEQTGGSPLWLETQNVQADKNGHYTVWLGSSKTEGLPISLFVSEQAQWLGVQPSGQNEEPRVLLLSVPYALKAADAETLGGLPASAFVQSNAASVPKQSTSSKEKAATPQSNASSAESAAPISGSGTRDFIPLWTSSTALGNSLIYQSNGMLGVGTKAPKSTIEVHSTVTAVSGTSTGVGKAGVYGLSPGFGVQGIGNSTTSTGVSGIGVQYGVTGAASADQPNAAGVYGTETSATSGYPVYGVEGLVKTSQKGTGVYGVAQATTGSANGVFGQTASAGGAGGLFRNTSTATGAQILVAEDGSGTQRLSVDTQGNVNVITGTTTQVKGPLSPVNHARTVVNIQQNQNYFVTLDWSFPFPDTSYTVTCTPLASSGLQGNGQGVYTFQVTSIASTSFQVEVAAIGTGDVTVNCIGVHD